MTETDLEKTSEDAGQTQSQESKEGSAHEGKPAEEHAHHERGLLAIALFKLSKAVFFSLLGLGALKLIHANLGDVALRVAAALHFDPEGQFVSMLQDKADLVSGHQLREASMLSFGYAAIALTEGIGLWLEKVWAEYLTTILTAGALPFELFEIWRKPTGFRVALLIINLLVLAYLLWFLKRRRAQERESDKTAATA